MNRIALIALLLIAPLSAHAQEGYNGQSWLDLFRDQSAWDHEIDISTAANPCTSIQAALYEYLSDVDTTPYIRIHGSATLDNDDFHTLQLRNLASGATTNGPYKVCVAEAPSDHFDSSDYPIADGTAQTNYVDGLIYFDNVQLTINCASPSQQTVNEVFWQAGSSWLNGYISSVNAGFIANAPAMAGNIDVRYSGDCDGSAAAGKSLQRSSSSPLSTATSQIFLWANGAQRRDASTLRVRINGRSSDEDDLGVWVDHASQWQLGGGFRIENMNTAGMFTGSVLSDLFHWYLTGNDYGIVIGSYPDGGDRLFYSSCAEGTGLGSCAARENTVQNFRFSNSTVEGQNQNDVVFFEGGSGLIFDDVYMESRGDNPADNHSLLIGGGVCVDGTRAGKTCGTANDCTGGGTCTCAVGAGRSWVKTAFIGTTTPDDVDVGTPDFGGTEIGMCSQNSGASNSANRIDFHGTMTANLDATTGLPVAFQWAPELNDDPTGSDRYSLPIIDVSGVTRTGSFYWPNYPLLTSANEISIPFSINDSTWDPTTNNYIPIGASTDGVAEGNAAAFIPIPRNGRQLWQAHALDLGRFAAPAGGDECSFTFRVGNYAQTTVNSLAGTAVETDGGNVGGQANVRKVFTPDSTLVFDTSGNENQIGIRVSQGSGDDAGSTACDELYEKGMLTLLPLK